MQGSNQLQHQFIRLKCQQGRIFLKGASSHAEGHEVASERGQPDGNYARWSWNGCNLTAECDSLGMWPLFYCSGDQEVWVGTSPQILIENGCPSDLDPMSLAVFMHVGFFLENDTPFRHIRVLPPRGRLTWNGEATVRGNAWSSQACSLERGRAVDRFVELMRDSIARRLPKGRHWAMPLSGGRDSRYLLLELLRHGESPEFVITTRQYPPRANVDVEVAATLARALRLPHVVISPTPRFQAEYTKNERTYFLADEHAWFVGVADRLQSVQVSFDGIGGDTLTGHWLRMPWRTDYENGRLDAVAARILSKSRWDRYPEFGGMEFPEHDEVAHRVHAALKRFADHHNPVTQFMFWNRTRREIATMPCGLMRGVVAYTPFLDLSVYEFLSSLPPEVMGVNELHDAAFERAFPDRPSVPYAAFGKRKGALRHYLNFATRVALYNGARPRLPTHRQLAYPLHVAAAVVRGGGLKRLYHLSPSRVLYRRQLSAAVAARAS